jgi:hypothetical protein
VAGQKEDKTVGVSDVVLLEQCTSNFPALVLSRWQNERHWLPQRPEHAPE